MINLIDSVYLGGSFTANDGGVCVWIEPYKDIQRVNQFVFDPRGVYFRDNTCSKSVFPQGNCDLWISGFSTRTWSLPACTHWTKCTHTCGKMNAAFSVGTKNDSLVCVLSGNSNLLCNSEGVCADSWLKYSLMNLSGLYWVIIISVALLLVIFLFSALGYCCGRRKNDAPSSGDIQYDQLSMIE